MLKVAGGTYLELCHVPEWRQVYGSGARAACAVSAMCSQVELHTYVGPDCADDLKALCSSFGVRALAQAEPETIAFEYFHGLSTPTVWPLVHKLQPRAPLLVDGAAVLRFGMLEGDARVTAKRAVYDPQSVFNPRPFAENGSVAESLAVVLNRPEARALVGTATDDALAAGVLALANADVVILKQGADGALVVTRLGGRHRVAAFDTPSVFPIGSGDVFSAVFAARWAEHGDDPLVAAETASLAAAHYCSTRSLPVPAKRDEILNGVPGIVALPEPRRPGKRRCYLAGPFFNLGQRWLIEEAKDALEGQGLDVFSPFHDVGHGQAQVVVPQDLEALKSVDIVLGLVDGLDPGTLFELGYARSKNIPVVAFVEQEDGESLKLLSGSGCHIERDFATAIYRTNWVARQT